MFSRPVFARASKLANPLSKIVLVARPMSATFSFSPSVVSRSQVRGYVLSTSGEHIEQLIDKLSDNEYSQIANEYLETLSDELEILSEDYPQIDAELSLGVMTLSVGEGKTYVINKQPPNKQIWLSSPISGPKRYDLIGGKWITLRDHSSLTELLLTELLAELGTDVSLDLEN